VAHGERLVGIHPVREALRARRRTLHRVRIRTGASRRELEEIRALAREAGVPVEDLDAGDARGDRPAVELDAGPLPELSVEELAARAGGSARVLALDEVEDPQNLGALCRVAEAAGVQGLLLTRRHAPPLSPAVSRASAGALEHLVVARVPNLRRALNHLKSQGYWVLGADLDAASDLFELPDRLLQGRLVVVLGGEGRGIREGVRECLDHRARIPMAGRVASLNVAAAGAVVLFDLVRRDRAQRRVGADPGSLAGPLPDPGPTPMIRRISRLA
jgi:23S rRNA (guanosine2251-2'-O)-methyltransferase